MHVRSLITIITVCISLLGFGQTDLCKQDWTPLCGNNLPAKFFYIKMQGPIQYHISSKSKLNEIGNGSADISGNRTSTIRLKFPVLNKTGSIITAGFRYTDEQFYFKNNSPKNYPLYASLNDRNLKSLGTDVKAMFHLKGNRSIVFQTSWFLAGDFYKENSNLAFGDLLKSSVAVGYAIKKDAITYKAFGVYFGYTFGKPSVYPVFNYLKRYPNGWGIDLLLPQSARVWKNYNNKLYLYANTKISGTSYNIHLENSILDEVESLQLRQANVIGTFGIMKRLNKWIWIEGEAGYSTNLNFNLSEANFKSNSKLLRPDTDYLIESDLSGAPYFSFSVFLAMPRNLIDRFSK